MKDWEKKAAYFNKKMIKMDRKSPLYRKIRIKYLRLLLKNLPKGTALYERIRLGYQKML